MPSDITTNTMTDDDLQLDDLPQPVSEGTVPPDELDVDGDNPNQMEDTTFGLLCDRMRENGWLGGPVITDADGLIADGEHRWRAAQEIGLAEVPVRQYDIDDATRRLWRQELNKIHGEHDRKRDALEYDALLDAGFSEEVTELTEAAGEDLDELLAELRMDGSRKANYDYDPEHNVHFEDCVEGMRERLDDDSVDMVFTSPPYNVDISSTESAQKNSVTGYTDTLPDDEYKELLTNTFGEICRVVKPSGHVFINLQHGMDDGQVNPSNWAVDLLPMPFRSYIVWNKNTFPHGSINANNCGRFHQTWEPIYHFSESEQPLNDSGLFSVWREPPPRGEYKHNEYGEHPAVFPVSLVNRAIDATTEKGDVILDPFMGSGTTAVAAIRNDRDYIGFELDEQGAYKPIIERRIGEAKRQREASVNQEEATPADD